MADESKYPTLYWDEYSDRIKNHYNMKKTGHERYNGPCPHCGGADRFWINSYENQVKVHCNQCNDFSAIMRCMVFDDIIPPPNEIAHSKATKSPVNDNSEFDKTKRYHERKGIELLGGAKLDGDNVVIPMYGRDKKRINKQTITPDGNKKFEAGKPTSECYLVINGPPEGITYIAEGYATAASVAQCTNRPTVCAFSASNIPKVTEVVKDLWPDANYFVAADNDDEGKKYAERSGLMHKAPAGYNKRDWNDVMLEDGPSVVKKMLSKVKPPKPLFVPLGDLEFKRPEWIIDGLLERNTFACCFGSPAAGKTFLVLDMALCVATGQEFHGHAVKKGPVFYIAGEGHNGFARRAAAWSKANDIPLKDIPFFKSSRSIILTEDESVNELINVIDSMVEQYGEPQLIVVDTLARSMGAADENSTKDMGAAIRAVDDIRNAYDCTLLAVHHTGHSQKDRARGSSALLGALDAEFLVDKWNDQQPAKIEVKFTKMKDAKMPEPLNFMHREIDLRGADLEDTTSVVLEVCQDKRPQAKKDNLSDKQRKFMQIFDETKGSQNYAKINDMRDNYYNSLGEAKQDTKKSSYQSVRNQLCEKGIISQTKTTVYDERDNGT